MNARLKKLSEVRTIRIDSLNRTYRNKALKYKELPEF